MPTLKELRLQAGLTQADLATRSGLREATLSALENGRSQPHSATVASIASALNLDIDTVHAAIAQTRAISGPSAKVDASEQLSHDWPFLAGLDPDLRSGLGRSLVAEWTHSSTAIEGNTITAGDTLFVLTEGLTVNGKSLREHQELHGHAQALGLMAAWTRSRQPVRIEHLHQLHRAVQTGTVIDVFAPVGKWKVEPNGTTALTTSGKTAWHDYASPRDVQDLMNSWLHSLARLTRPSVNNSENPDILLDAYTDVHLGFVGIHPYADGNGRMARLLANIPVLRAGHPPLLVSASKRRDYLVLLGDYSITLGQPRPGDKLVHAGPERNALRTFFAEQWLQTRQLVAEFHERQRVR